MHKPWGTKIAKKSIHYTFMAVLAIDSIMRTDKKPQVYLEECKYAVKEKKLTSFIDAELELNGFDSISDSE